MNTLRVAQVCVLTFETSTNISSASTKEINYRKPDGTVGTWTASLGGTTQATYTTTGSTLNIVGKWAFEVYVVISGVDKYFDITYIDVIAPLDTWT